MSDDELERLAQVGREKAAQEEYARGKRDREAAAEQDTEQRREREERMLRAVSPFWSGPAVTPVLAYVGYTFLVVGVVSWLVVWMPLTLFMDHVPAWADVAIGGLAVCAVAASLVVRAMAGPRARAALDAERAWATRQPFALTNHEELLAHAWSSSIVLDLHFRGDPPNADLLSGVLASDGASWTVEQRGPRDVRATRASAPERQLAWLHETVEQRLRPLHEKYPLFSVVIQR